MTTKAQAVARVHRIMVDEPWGGYTQGGNRIGRTPAKPYDVYGVTVQVPAHDMDCSSSAALAVWCVFGYLPFTYTGNEYDGLTSRGWKAHKVDQHRCWDGYTPKAGDIVLRNAGHTAVFQGADTISEFSANENHAATGGRQGDQTGWESKVTDYWSTKRWDWIFECPAGEWGATRKAETKEDAVTDADIEKIANKVVDRIKAETNDPTGRGYNLNVFDHVKWIAAAVSDIRAAVDRLVAEKAE